MQQGNREYADNKNSDICKKDKILGYRSLVLSKNKWNHSEKIRFQTIYISAILYSTLMPEIPSGKEIRG